MAFRDVYGCTKLMLAIIDDNFELFSDLLSTCINVDETDLNGWTALMYTCSYNRPKMFTRLLEKNADINLRNEDGVTALSHACRADISVLSRLLELKTNVNSRSNNGGTALMLACFIGKFEVVRVLLSNGADTEVSNVKNQTALDIANHYSHHRIAKLLLDHKQNLD